MAQYLCQDAVPGPLRHPERHIRSSLAMATTTTTTTITTLERTPATILNDYALHHSRQRRETEGPRTPSTASPAPPASDWDTTHRRVPSHRPINRDRDQSEVRVYLNNAERAFVSIMFTGLFINAVSLQMTRNSCLRGADTS